MAKRTPLSKTKRFEIFKRDEFTCQYCGDHPPSCILEIDHIVALAKGGDNEEHNLITSCKNCNRGKGVRSLSSAPKSLKEKAAQIKEAEAQILAYQAIIQAKEDRIKDEAFEILDYLGLVNPEGFASKAQVRSVKLFIKKLAFPHVMECAEIAFENTGPWKGGFNYFCGVCWNKIREMEAANG